MIAWRSPSCSRIAEWRVHIVEMHRHNGSLLRKCESELPSAIVRNDRVLRDEDQKSATRLDGVRDLVLPRVARLNTFVVFDANAVRGRCGDLRFDQFFFAVRVADEYEGIQTTVGRMPCRWRPRIGQRACLRTGYQAVRDRIQGLPRRERGEGRRRGRLGLRAFFASSAPTRVERRAVTSVVVGPWSARAASVWRVDDSRIASWRTYSASIAFWWRNSSCRSRKQPASRR